MVTRFNSIWLYAVGLFLLVLNLAKSDSLPYHFHLKKGYQLIQTEQYQQAIEVFYQVLELSPCDSSAYYGLGEVYRHQQQLTLAEKSYEQAIGREIGQELKGLAYLGLGHVCQKQG